MDELLSTSAVWRTFETKTEEKQKKAEEEAAANEGRKDCEHERERQEEACEG
jgi:hypothetical protein